MTPKATVKQEKKDLVESLSTRMKGSSSVTYVDYSGLDVSMQQKLKAKLAESNASMLVAKNTLIKLAAKDAGLPEGAFSDEFLTGQTAVIFSGEDAVSPIQTLGSFIKENEMPTMKAGVVEGTFQDKNGLEKISKLPSKDVLVGQAMGAIAAPLYGIVGTLQGNMQKLLFILDQASKKEVTA